MRRPRQLGILLGMWNGNGLTWFEQFVLNLLPHPRAAPETLLAFGRSCGPRPERGPAARRSQTGSGLGRLRADGCGPRPGSGRGPLDGGVPA